ncbi:MAG: tRNA lysidine(34) synthetase TilS [Pseudomonadota bacterium]
MSASGLTVGLTAVLTASLQRHVQPGQRLVVGLSGGVDSVVLLHALASLHRESVSALHVHHGISPNADRWSGFCAEVARQVGVPFERAMVAVERCSADGLEAAARRARHQAFAVSAGDWIVLAHHRDDQAETLLFNLLRGTGIAGAAAMRERSGRLLRPLLSVGRDDIERYAAAHRLDWIEDESNADTRHSRNFLRHRILASLTQRFPAAAKNLASAAARFAEAQDLLDDLARADLGNLTDFPVPVTDLQVLDEPRARNALRYLLVLHAVQIPSEARLREALRQMLTAGIDRHPAMHLGAYRLVRRRGLIYLEASTDRR